MFRTLLLIVVSAFFLTPAQNGTASGDGETTSLPEDLKALQGVWQSATDAKKQLKIMFLDDKVGFEIADPAAKPGEGVLGFMALSAAKHKETKGKRLFEVEVAKDYTRRVAYRFEKNGLVISVDGAEFRVERANTRASTSLAAKKLLGTWKVTGIEQRGKKGTAADSGLESVVFTEDRYVLKGPRSTELLNSFYRLDADKKPATMDWYGMKPNFAIPLIYEVKGNELRLAHPPFNLIAKGAKRPTTFDTNGTNTMLIRAERLK